MSPARRRPIACPIEWPNRERSAWWLPVACPPRARTVLSLLFPSLSVSTGSPLARPQLADSVRQAGLAGLSVLGCTSFMGTVVTVGERSRGPSGGRRPLPWPMTHYLTPHFFSLTARHRDMGGGSR
jgi:hypothetical protein